MPLSQPNPQLASVIDSSVSAVITIWVARVKMQIAASDGQTDEYLVDHTPRLLRSIARSFAQHDIPGHLVTVLENSKAHAHQRTRSNYTTSDLIGEYFILREVLLEEVSRAHPLNSSELLSLTRVLSGAMGAAVEEFALVRKSGIDTSVDQLVAYMSANHDEAVICTSAPADSTAGAILAAERSLAEAKEDLKVVADAVLTVILKVDLQQRYVFVNRAYEEWFGRPAATVLGRKVEDLIDSALSEKAFEYLKQAESGQMGSYEEIVTRKDGARRNALLTFVPARDSSEKIIGVVVTLQDIEQQKASETRTRSMFAHASVGFAVSDLGGHFLDVNPRFCEITGYGADELKAMTASDIIHTADLQMDRNKLDNLIDKKIESFVIEKRFIKKDKSTAWVRNSVSLLPNATGEAQIIRVAEDVTAVRNAEIQRRESEERFVQLADSMPQIVWTALPDGNLDYFNAVWFQYSGTTYEQNVGTGWSRAVHPDDLPEAVKRWTNSLASGAPYEAEFRLCAADGGYRWFVARATANRDRNGKIKKWFGTNTDIHDFKMINQQLATARENLESEQQKFKNLVADANTPMAVLAGPDLVFETVNQSYANLFDNRPLVGKAILKALPELEGQKFPLLLKVAFDKGETYREAEALAQLRRTSDGILEDRYFDLSYSPLFDQQNSIYGVFIQALDVTERVLSRRQLEETAERLRITIEAANMGTWELDPRGGSVNWSDRARELFGVPPEEKIDLQQGIDRTHPEDRESVLKAVEKALDPYGDHDYNIEYRLLLGGGEIKWVSVRGRSFYVETTNGRVTTRFVGTMLDVTERVLAELALRDAKERAELASAAKSSFLANMSHEIRTPLGAIMGFVSLLKEESITKETLSQYVSVIERNSTQLMRIIDDILDLSKVEAGMMAIELIDFSLVELLSDFASLMGFRARDKGVVFELRANSELPDIVTSDPTRIRQILTNVVGNAIKFTDKGSVFLNVEFKDDQLTFDVQDTGRGITPQQSAQLFQAFSQGDASTTRKYGGTGLGLVLTRRLSEALGGSFDLVESRQGVGSRFVASVKVARPQNSRFIRALGFAPEAIRNAGVENLLTGVHILLVEDSPDNQALFSIYLNRAGATIDIATDGQRGLEMATSDEYDVVLMDVQMPVMDGITAVKTLRAQGYDRPIIALTAHAMKEERTRCLEAGYTGFLSKPIQRSELVNALTKFRRRDLAPQ